MMKLTMVMAMLASSLQLAAQTKYEVVTLPDLGASGQANSINNRGWVAGGVNLPGGVYSEATAWINGSLVRLGTLGGPNSLVGWPVENNDGVIAGISEVSGIDTLGENGSSCQYFFPTDPPSGHACQGFRWQNGVMTALPTLGGTNSYATGANNQGQIVGWAENTVHDSTCAGSQVLQFRAVIWGPRPGQIQELPPLPGDSEKATVCNPVTRSYRPPLAYHAGDPLGWATPGWSWKIVLSYPQCDHPASSRSLFVKVDVYLIGSMYCVPRP